MARRLSRFGVLVLLIVAAATIGCSGRLESIAPPTIELVGPIQAVEIHADVVRYVLADGRTYEAPHGTYRDARGGQGGHLLVVGRDGQGEFIATFMRQDGMPADCYVENATGVERGDSIELRGILWMKSPQFRSSVPVPATGETYPGGTRFCLDDAAQVTSTQ